MKASTIFVDVVHLRIKKSGSILAASFIAGYLKKGYSLFGQYPINSPVS